MPYFLAHTNNSHPLPAGTRSATHTGPYVLCFLNSRQLRHAHQREPHLIAGGPYPKRQVGQDALTQALAAHQPDPRPWRGPPP